jgi:hypothetical protein
VAKNGWFSWRRTDTDDTGCWRVNREFSGKAWFWVKFKDEASNRVRMRFSGVRGWRFGQKAFTGSVYLGKSAGPNFHNISTRFGRWSDGVVGTKIHYSWAGATINNALHEFHDFSAIEGFIPPPDDINMLINLGKRGGFTTMMRQMGVENLISAVEIGYQNREINSLGFELDGSVDQILIDATGVPGWPQQVPLVSTFVGDINTGANFTNSDRMKRLAFHEIGHASHFVGSSVNFYRGLVAATVGANGHGNPNVILAGHLQVAESWAEHMALTMVKQQYPFPILNSSIVGRWETEHEDIRNESDSHILIGVFNDLIDDVDLFETVYDEDDFVLNSDGLVVSVPRTAMADMVSGGYTNSFFAKTMNSTTTSPDVLRQRCLEALPVGVLEADVNALFGEYNN